MPNEIIEVLDTFQFEIEGGILQSSID